jgi:hypothetical protein
MDLSPRRVGVHADPDPGGTGCKIISSSSSLLREATSLITRVARRVARSVAHRRCPCSRRIGQLEDPTLQIELRTDGPIARHAELLYGPSQNQQAIPSRGGRDQDHSRTHLDHCHARRRGSGLSGSRRPVCHPVELVIERPAVLTRQSVSDAARLKGSSLLTSHGVALTAEYSAASSRPPQRPA